MGYDIDWARNRTEDLFDKAIKTKRTFNASKMGLDLVGRGIDPPDFMKAAINKRVGAPAENKMDSNLTMQSFKRDNTRNFDDLLSSAKSKYSEGGPGFVIESRSPGEKVSGFTVGTYSTPEKAKTPDWISNLASKNAALNSAEMARKQLEGIRFVDEFDQDTGVKIGQRQMKPNLEKGMFEAVDAQGEQSLLRSFMGRIESTPEENETMMSEIKKRAQIQAPDVKGTTETPENRVADKVSQEGSGKEDWSKYTDIVVPEGEPGMLGFSPYVMGRNPKGVSTRMFPVERPETRYGDATYKNKKYADFVEKMKRLGLKPDGTSL